MANHSWLYEFIIAMIVYCPENGTSPCLPSLPFFLLPHAWSPWALEGVIEMSLGLFKHHLSRCQLFFGTPSAFHMDFKSTRTLFSCCFITRAFWLPYVEAGIQNIKIKNRTPSKGTGLKATKVKRTAKIIQVWWRVEKSHRRAAYTREGHVACTPHQIKMLG